MLTKTVIYVKRANGGTKSFEYAKPKVLRSGALIIKQRSTIICGYAKGEWKSFWREEISIDS